MAEIRIEPYKLPEKIDFNFVEIRNYVIDRSKLYKNMVYDENQVKEAKKDRASLNGLKNSLNNERKRIEAELLEPFREAKAQFNELIQIIDEPIKTIDQQVKNFESKKKEQKQEEIEKLFRNMNRFEWLELTRIFNPKWLNATYKIDTVAEDIEVAINHIGADLEILAKSYGPEAVEFYKETLDSKTAIDKTKEFQEVKARTERKQPEPIQEETQGATDSPKVLVKFSALLTIEQAKALREFAKAKGIELKQIKE